MPSITRPDEEDDNDTKEFEILDDPETRMSAPTPDTTGFVETDWRNFGYNSHMAPLLYNDGRSYELAKTEDS